MPVGATLVITKGSTGSLSVSGDSGAGIGGTYYAPTNELGNPNCGTVVIDGGTVTANGGGLSAGIGGALVGSDGGNGGNITINGGNVTATGGGDGNYGGAGIGGAGGGDRNSSSGCGGTLTINGGHVTLTAGAHNSTYGSAYGFGKGSRSIPNGPCELTLADASYLTLTDGTNLDPNGTYTINGDPTEDMIVVPELVYTGEILDTSEIRIDDSKTGTATYFGQTFQVKASADGWVLQDLGEVREAKEYTATFKKDDKEISKKFTVAQSGTQFVGDGTVKTYKDGAECSDFTADDTITVKATPTATGAAPTKASARLGGDPTAGQMAVFVGDTQVSAPAVKGADDSYTITVSAADVLTLGGVEPNQAITLTAKFVGNDNMADAVGTVPVNISAVAKVVNGSYTTYVGNLDDAFKTENDGATITLLKDVTRTPVIDIQITCNLDLGEHTITCTYSTAISIWSNANLTIQGAGEVISMNKQALVVGGNVTLEGGTFTSKQLYSEGVYINSANASLSVVNENVTIRNTGGSCGLAVNNAQSVQLSGGTYSGTAGAISIVGGSLTLGGLLVHSGDTRYAYFDESGAPIAGKLDDHMLTDTMMVKKCTHDKSVCEYMPNENAETHAMTCLACGYTGAVEDCTYSGDYGNDEANHWQTCTLCGGKKTEAHSGRLKDMSSNELIRYCPSCLFSEKLGTLSITPDFSVAYGETGSVALTYEAEMKEGYSLGCVMPSAWYLMNLAESSHLVIGNKLQADLPDDLAAGEYRYFFSPELYYQGTCLNGLLVVQGTVTVTPAPLAITEATAEGRTYDGTSSVKITGVMLDGIVNGDDVSVDTTNLTGTLDSSNAGSYTAVTLPEMTLTGADAGNYTLVQPETAVPASVEITRLDAQITVGTAAYNKTFGDAAFLLDVKDNNPEADVRYEVTAGTDVVSVEGGMVTIHAAGRAVITVSLPESTNYNAAADKTITVTVEKKDSGTVAALSRSCLYSRENADSIDLAALLPKDCGTVTYGAPVVSGNVAYSAAPAVKEGKLCYTQEIGNINDQGSIAVTVTTQNYADITITINIKLTDKVPVSLKKGTKVTLENNVLTYGEPLSKLLFHKAEFIGDDGKTVAGTLAWKKDTDTPNAGTAFAVWVFTPKDCDAYTMLEGEVEITVNKAVPRITAAPVARNRIYRPSGALEKAELTGGEARGADGKTLAGTWDWHRADIIPSAGVSSHKAVFTPEDTTNYTVAETNVTINVEKAVPYIAVLPLASAVTYGDSLNLSVLAGGSAQYGDGTGKPGTGTDSAVAVVGIFAWKDKDVKPAASDSDKTEYAVIFTPEDTQNYSPAETALTLAVHKAENAPDMPPAVMNVSNSIEKVSSVPLPEGWTWQESDRDKALEPDKTVTATAVYTGEDKGNYINETVETAITRSACEHTAGEILYTGSGEKAPDCMENGLGHRECTKCHAILEKDIVVSALGHDYNEGEVTKEPTVESEGEKTYTCSRCGHTYTEAVPKKIPRELWIDNLEPSVAYTGSAVKQEGIRVYYGETPLRETMDYTISYKNNTNAGTAQMIVAGKGNYTGKAVKTFTIEPINISTDSGITVIVTTVTETGKNLKPAVTVTWNGKKLKEKMDYTLSYHADIKTAGDYDITITGKQNYTGTIVKAFHVKPGGTKLLNSAKVTGIKKSYPYQSGSLESDLQNITVKIGKTTLAKDTDYTVRTENTETVGTAAIIIEASSAGAYAGEKRITTAITGTDLRKGSIKGVEKSYPYTGAPVTPQITVYSGKNGSGEIIPADAYTVSYSSNINKGKATITAAGIPGKGYSGSIKVTYQIGRLNLQTEKAAGNIKVMMPADISHTKGGAKPQPVITHTYNGTARTLREGADYTLKYSNNMTAGGAKTPIVKITGTGNYSGSITENYAVSAQDIHKLSIIVADKAYGKNKEGSSYYSAPKVYDLDGKQLKAGKDYTVQYTYADSGQPVGKNDKIAAGTKLCATVTAASAGSYTGTLSAAYFVREAKEVKDIAKTKNDKIAPQQYTGSAVTPEIRLYKKTGKTKDYLTTEAYEIIGCYNNTKRGTATILVRGKGAYSGVKRITFKIVQKNIK